MPETVTKGFWFFEPNLVSTLLILSDIVSYSFDRSDLDAIEFGLTSTSQEKNIWWSYQLIGERTIDLRFARDEDNRDIIFIELSIDKIFSSQIDLCIYVVQNFTLQYRHGF